MPQFACTYKTISSILVPCPLPLPSYPMSLLLKDHLRMSGVMSRAKIALSCALSPKTRVTNASAPLSPTALSVVTKNLTMPKGIVPCGSTVTGASTSTTPTMTAPSPIINALKTYASFWGGTLWSGITAQSPLKTTHMSCDALQLTMKMRSYMTSRMVATGIGGA